MKGSRGARRDSFTLVTPANHYPSRLPPFGDAPVVKLVTPRFAPARIGEYLLALPAGGGTVEPVAPGFETFLYALDGDATARVDGRELPLRAGGFAYLPASAPFELAAGAAPARLLMVKRRYEPWPGRDAAGAARRPPRRRAVRRHAGRPASAAASCSPSPTRRSTSP